MFPHYGLASSAFARHYSRNLVDFFSSAYLDVSLRRVPLVNLLIQLTIRNSSLRWFPNSEIHGSMLIYSSPWLIAVSHVLLRLLMPRHSPYALCNLNLLFSFALSFAISFYRFGCLFFTTLWWQNCSFLTFFLGKTNFYLFLLLSQYLFVCFIRFSMIICKTTLLFFVR